MQCSSCIITITQQHAVLAVKISANSDVCVLSNTTASDKYSTVIYQY